MNQTNSYFDTEMEAAAWWASIVWEHVRVLFCTQGAARGQQKMFLDHLQSEFVSNLGVFYAAKERDGPGGRDGPRDDQEGIKSAKSNQELWMHSSGVYFYYFREKSGHPGKDAGAYGIAQNWLQVGRQEKE